MSMDGYQALANAIVKQAADDYVSVLVHLKKRPKSRELRLEQRRLEHFFRSDWYNTLTNVNPNVLLKALQVKAEKKKRMVRGK